LRLEQAGGLASGLEAVEEEALGGAARAVAAGGGRLDEERHGLLVDAAGGQPFGHLEGRLRGHAGGGEAPGHGIRTERRLDEALLEQDARATGDGGDLGVRRRADERDRQRRVGLEDPGQGRARRV
jgi:hypothetical protein